MSNPENIKMHTPDLADENFAKLEALFPNAVTETINEDGAVVRAIDPDVLQQEINTHVLSGKEERYQFTWPDKKKSVLLANAPIAAALRPCREESVDFDNTENLYIEGDNLDVLKLLRETYLNRVKMIYIDPPYNTGNDFVYEDDFAEDTGEFLQRDNQYDEQGNRLVSNLNSNGRFHTDWLNMLYPRLRIARDLLASNGVIFISIDDGEIAQLKKICDEIFGEVNFVAQITVVSNPRGRDYGGVARMHDFILVYQKSSELELSLINDPEHSFKSFDDLGGFELRELRNRNIAFNSINRPNLYYPFYINTDSVDENGLCDISLEKQNDWFELFPIESQGFKTVWRWGKTKALENLNTNIKAKPMQNGSYQIVEKYRESRKMARSVWWDKESNTERGTLLVKTLFNDKKVFDFPKPVEMVMRMIEMSTSDNDIVLDFFSGSATTAHAVMQLNAEDGGNRKFVMVQIPEACDEKSEAFKAGYKNICEIGKERIRRAGTKIKNEAGEAAQNLDIGFRVLKLDSSNMKEVYYTPGEYAQMNYTLDGFMDNIKEDRTDEDLLFQIMLELGIPLSAKIKQDNKVWCVDDNYLLACFSKVDTALITEIAKKKPYYAVFRDSSFTDDSAMVNFEQVFATYSPTTIRRVL